MRATKLVIIIAITLIAVIIIGCDEAAMIEDIVVENIITDMSSEEATKLAELKAEDTVATDTSEEATKLAEPKAEGATVAPTNPNREKVLNFSWEDATEAEKRAHGKLVIGLAVNVNVLDIANRNPEPLVIEVGIGETIEVKNSGTVDHTFNSAPWRGRGITIPAGGSRGFVVTEFAGFEQGLVSYSCDDNLIGIFYINPELTVKPDEKQFISFTVVEFLLPDGSNGPALEKVKVTVLEGRVTKKTAADGTVLFRRHLPLTVLLEKEGYFTTEVVVSEDGQGVVLPGEQKNISFRVVEPLLPDRNGPGIGEVTVTPLEGSDERVKQTDADGNISFFGTPPLTVWLEKPGYIAIETVVLKEEIILPNEWPEEVAGAVLQLGLAEIIASGELILRWGDDEFLPLWAKEMGKDGIGAIYACPNIIVRKYEDRNFMLRILVHEAMHAWQGRMSTHPPCDISGWPPSKEGKAWIAAMEKDLEIGSIPGIDGEVGTLSPWENQAELYSVWYFGRETKRLDEVWDQAAELKKLYRLAPNRCKYFEDRFGPPPPRR